MQTHRDTTRYAAPGIGRVLAAAAIAAALLPAGVLAQSPPGEGDAGRVLALSGFGTLGTVITSNDRVEYVRDVSQPYGAARGRVSASVDSRIGLQANVRPHADYEGVVQVVSKLGYDGSYMPVVNWAFLKAAPIPEIQLRAGRLGFDVFMQSDSRDVGYSYMWVRPPVDVFGPLSVSMFDGADVLAVRPLGEGLVRAKAYAGRARGSYPLSRSENLVFDIGGSRLAGGHLEYQWRSWTVRASYARLRFQNELPINPLLDGLNAVGLQSASDAAAAIGLRGKQERFRSLGVVYDEGPLQSQFVLSHLDSNSATFPGYDSGFVSAGYRVGKFTPYATYSWANSKHVLPDTGLPNVPPFDALIAGVGDTTSALRSNQRTVAAGVRYDFRERMALKVQVDRVANRDDTTLLYQNTRRDWNGRLAVLSVVLDFIF